MASSTRDRSKMLLNGQLASDRTYTVLDIEVDNQCGLNHILSQTACSSTRVSDVTLYRYEDVPNFLRGNPYIKKGYRAYLPASQCFSSLFLWSNETINIWSHLVGCIIFFVAMCVENMARFLQTSPTSQTSQLTDHIYLTTAYVPRNCIACIPLTHIKGSIVYYATKPA
ncbi:PAQR3 [Bugula neritina]|uniref:PAQR3 n=1 Tax=Bugula neritina TaxID=10212 RepID=A0A7J7JTT9_BUGNE|nr:PAQR3 [Bugula neritina]